MPFKSKAQQRFFYQKLKDGEFSKKMVDEWSHSTDYSKLPDKKKKKREKEQQFKFASIKDLYKKIFN